MTQKRKPTRPPTSDRLRIRLLVRCSDNTIAHYYDGLPVRESTRLAIGRALRELGMVIPESQRKPRTERDAQFFVSPSDAPKGAA